MRNFFYENQNDGFINLYQQGVFIRCFEKSALYISELTGYTLYPNINKKTGYVFLECAFPKAKKQYIISQLEKEKRYIRYIDESDSIEETFGVHKLEIESSQISDIKNSLVTL